MTSPTMPTPSTPMTLIRWRDANCDKPAADGWYTGLMDERLYAGTVRRIRTGVRFVRGEFTVEHHQTIIGWADVLSPSDIQTGEFVSVEAVRGLQRCSCNGPHGIMSSSSAGRWVRLSDIEKLGGIG